MNRKSDIECILESQTWKSQSPIKRNIKKSGFRSPKLKPLSNLNSPIIEKREEHQKFEIKEHEPRGRKSILAIPLLSFTSRIQHLVKDEELNTVKIPTFPKFPFGQHKEMLGDVPKFEVIPKEFFLNSESVKNLKLESGRIKRTITTNLSSNILKLKKKMSLNPSLQYSGY